MASKAKTLELEDNVFFLLEGNLKRIFATPIGYTTFREFQNVVFNCANGQQEAANFFFEMLINGKLTQEVTPHQKQAAQKLIAEFMMPIRVSKDIHERGEFINFITSDMLAQQERCIFFKSPSSCRWARVPPHDRCTKYLPPYPSFTC